MKKESINQEGYIKKIQQNTNILSPLKNVSSSFKVKEIRKTSLKQNFSAFIAGNIFSSGMISYFIYLDLWKRYKHML